MLLVVLTNGMKRWVDMSTARDLQKSNRIAYVLDERDISSVYQTDDVMRWYQGRTPFGLSS